VIVSIEFISSNTFAGIVLQAVPNQINKQCFEKNSIRIRDNSWVEPWVKTKTRP